MSLMPINAVLTEFLQCWRSAEQALIRSVREKYLGAPEEVLTFLLQAELTAQVSAASSENRFERAFRLDLERAFPTLTWGLGARQIAEGLKCTVNFHNRAHEGRKSGADLGLVFARPSVRHAKYNYDRLEVQHTLVGLLVQAKLGKRPKTGARVRWGKLTRPQREKIPRISPFLALLLYRYGDAEERSLMPLDWQLCEGFVADEIENWLGQDSWPSLQPSEHIFRKLAESRIGTSDLALLSELVNPKTNGRVLEIRIDWPDDKQPPASVDVSHAALPSSVHMHLRE